MLSLSVLAAGVVGCCLGDTVVRLWGAPEPMIPAAKAKEAVDLVLADKAEVEAERDRLRRERDEARVAMERCAQCLSVERRVHAETRLRLGRTEQELGDVHEKLAWAKVAFEQFPLAGAAFQEFADAGEMGLEPAR